jgi:hypothetical protein
MSFLPERTILGQLEIMEVYDFYDKPVLFSCKNNSGQIFITVWVDILEDSDIWLYAPVSSSRFNAATKGLIELRNIFIYAEDFFVYQVEISHTNKSNTNVNLIYCDEIKDDYLPDSGTIIEPNDNCSHDNINLIANQKRREIVNFVLQFSDKEITEAPVGELGLILYSLQEAIDAIGQINLGKSASHIIPLEVKQKTQVVMSGVFSGSFGMRLEGTVYEEDTLGLNESFLGQCLKEFIQLINIGANEHELPAKLDILKQKTARKYTEFLKALTRIGISKLHIDWASPEQKVQTGEIELETVRKVLDIIGKTKLRVEAEICVNVTLIQINYKNRTTTLQEVGSTNKKYKCYITESALKDVLSINKTMEFSKSIIICIATIQDYVTLSTVTIKEKHEYELLSLKPSTEPIFTQQITQ